MSLYSELVLAGCTIDSHESDLYVLATTRAEAILRRHTCNAKRFIGTDDRCWWDVPFMFEPWWENRQRKA